MKPSYGDLEDRVQKQSEEIGMLRSEVETMRMEHAIWEKHSLCEIVKEREELRKAIKEIHDEALRCYRENAEDFERLDGQVWNAATKYFQVFGWMKDRLKDLVVLHPEQTSDSCDKG